MAMKLRKKDALALLIGGLIAAPLAAYLVRVAPTHLLGVAVGGLILITNARTLFKSFEVGATPSWIGYGASILRGVKVGQNCVIGTNSVVTKDVPDNAVVGGVPAKVLRLRPAPQAMRYE